MPTPLGPDKLFERALRYLERFAASRAGVRQVLMRGLQRDKRRGEDIPEEAGGWVEGVLDRLTASGLLNDRLFAETKVRALRRAGASTSRIRQKLGQKGVDDSLVQEALASEEGGTDFGAAIAFARKRRLGPFSSSPDKRTEDRTRHLASLARAGFSLTVARKVLDAPTPEALMEEPDQSAV